MARSRPHKGWSQATKAADSRAPQQITRQAGSHPVAELHSSTLPPTGRHSAARTASTPPLKQDFTSCSPTHPVPRMMLAQSWPSKGTDKWAPEPGAACLGLCEHHQAARTRPSCLSTQHRHKATPTPCALAPGPRRGLLAPPAPSSPRRSTLISSHRQHAPRREASLYLPPELGPRA